MKLSIVIAVLDSHEVVRRQMLHFARMPLPDGVELVLVDDGSEPPLSVGMSRVQDAPKCYRIVRHHHPAAWTQPAARNYGVNCATGEWVLCTDIDHIISKELIETVLKAEYDVIRFKREVAILSVDGEIVQTWEDVKRYGFAGKPGRRRGFRVSPHTNSFAMRRELYEKLGGVSEKKVGSGRYPNREEMPLKRAYKQLAKQGEITLIPDDERPVLYLIPNGRFCGDPDYNPFGLFHNLSRKGSR